MVRRTTLRRDFGAPAVFDQRANDVRLVERAAVGHRADGCGHLERRDADLIAHRHRGERARIEGGRVPDDPRVLTAKIRRGGLTEPEAADVAAQSLGSELQARP